MNAPISIEASALLQYYSFDLAGSSTDHLIAGWRQTYEASWIRAAVIEALYQGRYKAVSVEQILVFWLRRGQPLRHFNHEFEQIVCNQFGRQQNYRNYSVRPIREASLSTPSTTNLIEQNSDRCNQISYPYKSGEETNPAPELPTNLIGQIDLSISEHPTSNHKSENNPLKEELTQQRPTDKKLGSLGNLSKSTIIQSSQHDSDDFEPPNNPDLLDKIRQLTQQPIESFECQHGSPSNKLATKLGNNKNINQHKSIHQFKPASDRSEFYFKLRAVAQYSNKNIKPR